ncbi:MAG: 2-C-methyl-D-erythritol 4-phosphate cytidylyltransferase [Verrucomicrobiota bacterium]
MSDCAAILLAAGRSRRLGYDKILTPIAGKPVVQYSLEVFKEMDAVGSIILVTRPDLIESLNQMSERLEIDKPIEIIEGGKERQDSVWAGLRHLKGKTDYVAVHDAARPLLTEELMKLLLAKAKEVGGAICGQSATDTMKLSSQESMILKTVDRANIWTVQTPQIFRTELILEAYECVHQEATAITDDASAMEAIGKPVALVDGGIINMKITHPRDWEVIELLLNRSKGLKLRQIGHDLCNSLSPIMGYLPLVEKYGGDSEKFRNYVSKMQKSSEQSQLLLNQFQELVRIIFPKNEDKI